MSHTRGVLGIVTSLAFVALGGVTTPAVQAAQRAEVLPDTAAVHQYPNRTSPEVGRVRKGSLVPLSSDLLQDVNGEYWYKLRQDAGNYGYVRANEVFTEDTIRGLHQAGISRVEVQDATRQLPWIFCLRAMGLGGAQFTFAGGSSPTPAITYGGEGEFTFTPLIGVHGYWHRFFSVGAAFQYFTPEPIASLSAVFRFYTERVWEPELRLRFGRSLTTDSWEAGGTFGVQIPFSVASRSYLAGYVELGGVTGLQLLVSPIYTWLSAGIGWHF